MKLVGHLYFPVFYLFSLLILQVSGCSQDHRQSQSGVPEVQKGRNDLVEIVSPKRGEVYTCGDIVPFSFRFKKTVIVDSISLHSADMDDLTFAANFGNIGWPTGKSKTGQNIVKVTFYYNDSLKETHSVPFVLLSDIIPKAYKYTLVNTYPHDPEAFTQGLIYDKGVLYESTGRNGHSSIRIVEIATGRVLKKVDLNPELFGEGIAFHNNNVYQITWKNQTGFIYEKETLDLIRSFDYPISEGWGLTGDGKNLYMTDGTSFLYIIEPEYFTQIGQLDVFSNKGRVNQLNELEYVDGKIFANILGETNIAIIDPANGKITGEIELAALVLGQFKENSNKVLNGIAFNPSTRHLYVTGKLWPVLYEIKLEGYFDN